MSSLNDPIGGVEPISDQDNTSSNDIHRTFSKYEEMMENVSPAIIGEFAYIMHISPKQLSPETYGVAFMKYAMEKHGWQIIVPEADLRENIAELTPSSRIILPQ